MLTNDSFLTVPGKYLTSRDERPLDIPRVCVCAVFPGLQLLRADFVLNAEHGYINMVIACFLAGCRAGLFSA